MYILIFDILFIKIDFSYYLFFRIIIFSAVITLVKSRFFTHFPREDIVLANNFYLNNYGRLFNPANWFSNPNYLINRLYYIVSGTAFYKDSIPLKPGHFYIFKASPEFKVSQDPKDPVDHIFFDFFSAMELSGRDYIEIDINAIPKAKGIVDSLMCDYSLHTFPPKLAESYLNIIFYHLEDYIDLANTYTELTRKCLWLIHGTSPSELSVNQIAEDLNININHLIRTFKKDTGITPLKYISLMKTDLAIEYVRQGMSLDDIAVNLGYSSVSALSVFFKSITGQNISNYR